jgi:hypothetical protein
VLWQASVMDGAWMMRQLERPVNEARRGRISKSKRSLHSDRA